MAQHGSISGRARRPISRTIEPPLPTTICFCDSVSTSRSARSPLPELLHFDRDRVGKLFLRQAQRLLAHELGDLHLQRQVGALLLRKYSGPSGSSVTSS